MLRPLASTRAYRSVLGAALAAAVLGAAAGCGGGIGSQSNPIQQTTTVIVETVQQGTTDLLPVAADITVGGITAKIDMVQGWAVISGVPLGDKTPPEQPLTVSAPGWTTTSQILALNTYSYTSVSVALAPADPATTATMEGTVTAEGGAPPIANAAVTFTPASGDPVIGYTDNAGHYKFTGVPAGRGTVIAQAAGHLEARKQVALVPTATGTNSPVNLALLSGSTKLTVAGQVLRVGVDTPIAGAQVQIGDLPVVATASSGLFSVPQVLVGTQTIRVNASGYDDKQQQITVTPGMSLVTVYLAPTAPLPPPLPYTITGTVTLRGRPDNAGATVTAFNKDLGQVMDTVTTNAAGAYYLFVPPGSYRITVQFDSHTIASDVTLLGGGRVLTGIDFQLSVAS